MSATLQTISKHRLTEWSTSPRRDPKDAKQALDAAAIADLDAQLEALKVSYHDSSRAPCR